MNYIKTNDSINRSKHWFECDSENKPFIQATRQGRYYNVLLDMYPAIYDLNKKGSKLVEEAIENECDAVESQRVRKHGIHFSIGNVISRIGQVLPERVDSFCTKLFEISTNPQNIVEDEILKTLRNEMINK
jgi:hypothetical protein